MLLLEILISLNKDIKMDLYFYELIFSMIKKFVNMMVKYQILLIINLVLLFLQV